MTFPTRQLKNYPRAESALLAAGNQTASQEKRSRTKLCLLITRISQRAIRQRQAATADAEIQLVPHPDRQLNPLFEHPFPHLADLQPIRLFRRAISRQVTKHLADLAQRKPEALSHLDEGEHTQLAPREASSISAVATAADQLLRSTRSVQVAGEGRWTQ